MSADERLHRAQAPLHKLLCVYAYVCVLECVCVRVLGHVTVPSISFLECSLKKNITEEFKRSRWNGVHSIICTTDYVQKCSINSTNTRGA